MNGPAGLIAGQRAHVCVHITRHTIAGCLQLSGLQAGPPYPDHVRTVQLAVGTDDERVGGGEEIQAVAHFGIRGGGGGQRLGQGPVARHLAVHIYQARKGACSIAKGE